MKEDNTVSKSLTKKLKCQVLLEALFLLRDYITLNYRTCIHKLTHVYLHAQRAKYSQLRDTQEK